MASFSEEIKITHELRPCFMDGKKALFHGWHNGYVCFENEGKIINALQYTKGIAELSDGSITLCEANEIRFADDLIKQYYFGEGKENNE